MKVGIIGLGNIAQKAYLPILATKPELDITLATRNKDTLDFIGEKYRIAKKTHTVNQLINSGIEAAFVHTATNSHPEIVKKLLTHGIHVYVDKPISYSYEEAKELVQLANQKRKIVMVGFNRRFAPMIRNLKDIDHPRIILMQKNRLRLPGPIRRFVFDDFIHVVDTLRFLTPKPVENVHVDARVKDGMVHHLVLNLSGEGYSAIGVMNRDNGITEESIEVQGPGEKWVVDEFVNTKRIIEGTETKVSFEPWDSTLYKRGFDQMLDHFLDSVRLDKTPSPSAFDSLATHELCEKIAVKLENEWN